MNFLMHSWLARDDEAEVAGAFLGDFVKGPIPTTMDPELQRGIRLHRHVDSVSNRMPQMRSTYWRFGPDLRRVAPVLLDLVADHLLAAHWNEYGEGELSMFTDYCYRSIAKYDIPSTAVGLFSHTVSRDLWSKYADFDVMLGIMGRILKRLNKEELSESLLSIGENLDLFHNDFRSYFPVLEDHVERWRIVNTKCKARQASLPHGGDQLRPMKN